MQFLSPPAIIAILIALSVHEWAHGYAAYLLGDPTAEQEGRLTLNPISHLDPLGTLLFVMVGFGWGKPVPVNPRYFKKPKRDTAIVAAAGPASNLILAWVAFFLLMLLGMGSIETNAPGVLQTSSSNGMILVLEQVLRSSIFINLALMAFNLIPIAPLDGSKILHMFIPYRYEHTYYEFMQRGPFFLLFLLILERFMNIPLLFGWIFGIMSPFLIAMGSIAAGI